MAGDTIDQKTELLELLEARRLAMAKEHLIPFAKYCNAKYKADDIHYLIADHLEAVLCGKIKRLMIFCPPQTGKLISDDCPLFTPTGWTTHGELKPGDFVFGRNGLPVMVEAVSQTGIADREVVFTDGGVVCCHGNHEWIVTDHKKTRTWDRVYTTEQIENDGTWLGNYGKRGGRARFHVDANVELSMPIQSLPVAPYVLGLWLGDGSTGKGAITSHPSNEIVMNAVKGAGYKPGARCVHGDTGVVTQYFYKLKEALRNIGVLDNKHIPCIYLCSSVQQRLELLAGLIDSDGTLDSENGRYYWSNINKRLIDDVASLIRSLGWRATIAANLPTTSTSGIVGKNIVYVVGFNPDLIIPTVLKYKRTNNLDALRRRRGIVSVSKCSPRPGRCIQVSGGIYLVGETMIPTHNSLLSSVNFPAWWLGHRPATPIILASYAEELATLHSRSCRTLLEGTEFYELFPKVRIRHESRAAARWHTYGYGGGMRAVGVGGGITGHPAGLGLIDDALKGTDWAFSEAQLKKVWDWYTNDFLQRLWEDAPIVLTMTRWAEHDLAGRILDSKEASDWTILRIPALSETQDERDGNNKRLGLPAGLPDPLGREPGVSCVPTRYSTKYYQKLKDSGLEWRWSAIYQGVPHPLEGTEIKRAWFQIVSSLPARLTARIRYWDLAATAGAGARTAGVLMAMDASGIIYICDVIAGQWSVDERNAIIKQTAALDAARFAVPNPDKPDAPIESLKGYNSVFTYVEQEPGSGGKEAVELMIRDLAGYTVSADHVSGKGSKEARMSPFISYASAGNMRLLRGNWNEMYLNELAAYPNGPFRDMCDGSSGAFGKIRIGGFGLGIAHA